MARAKTQRKIATATGRTTKGTMKTIKKSSITMHYKVCKPHATSAKSKKASNFPPSINKNSSPFVIIPYKSKKSFATAPLLGKSFVADVSPKSSPFVITPDNASTDKHKKDFESEFDTDSDSFAASFNTPNQLSSTVDTSLEPLIPTPPTSSAKSLFSTSEIDRSADFEKYAETDSETFAADENLINESEVEDFLTHIPSNSSSTFDFSKPLATTFPEPLVLVSPTPSISSPLTSPITSTNFAQVNKIARSKTRENLTYCSLQRLARRGGLEELPEPEEFTTKYYLQSHLENLISRIATCVSARNDNVATVSDVIRVMREMPRPVYGFEDRK